MTGTAAASSSSSPSSSSPSGSQQPYWTISQGKAIRCGWSCRSCKAVINRGEEIIVRDGRKMRFFYHRHCYAGTADPRTQPGSTFLPSDHHHSDNDTDHHHHHRNNNNHSKWIPGYHISLQAPACKGKGKWSVQQYGYRPAAPQSSCHPSGATTTAATAAAAAAAAASQSPNINTPIIQWGFDRKEIDKVLVDG